MASLAELGIKVTTDGVKQATDDLNKMNKAAGDAAAAAGKVDPKWKQNSETAAKYSTSIRQQRDELQKLLGQIDPTVAALAKLDNMEQKLAGFNAKGFLASDDFKVYQSRIDGLRSAIGNAGEAIEKFTLNSSAAQRELGVIFGEGLRGNFTSMEQSLVTLANRSGLLAAAFSPVGLAVTGIVAALGSFAIAAEQGQAQDSKLNAALLATNDYAGKSVGQLNDLATSIGNVSGSFGDAHDIVQALASTGKVAGDQFATVAQGVSDFAQVTGSSIQDAVETFTKLGDDPVKAATSLNDQYHYLTASVYEQIEAAQKQGDTEKAASIAQDALAESFSKRRESMVEDMGLLQKSWDELKTSASATWDAMLGIGRQKSIADQIKDIDSQIAVLEHGTTSTSSVGPLGALTGTSSTSTSAANNQAQIQALKLQREQLVVQQSSLDLADQVHNAYLTQVQDGIRAEKILEDLARGYNKADERAEAVKNVNAYLEQQYKTFGTLPSGVSRSSSGQYSGSGYDYIVTQEQKKIGGSSSVKPMKDDTIDLISANKDLASSIKEDVKQYQEQLKQWSQNTVAVNQYRDALNEKLKTDQAAIDLQVMSVGMGQQQYEMQRQLIQAQEDYDKQLTKLNSDYADKSKGMTTDTYNQQLSDLNEYNAKRIQQIKDGNQKMLDAEGDWKNGAKQGWQDFESDADNVARGVANTVSDAFSTFTDDLVTALNTGKLSFHSFATSVLEDIERIGLKLAEEQGVKAILSAFNIGSSSDIWSSLAGSFSAKGNVFSGGDISKYSGSIVSSPTLFSGTHITAFASGGNVMGEAGPEAILPLRRGADGKLGVASSGTSGGVTVNVTTNVDASGSASTSVSSSDQSSAYTALSQQLAALCRQQISKSIQPGGLIYNRLNGR